MSTVWDRADIANALMATYQTTCETANAIGGEDTVRRAAFFAGGKTVISALALNFGISPAQVLPPQPQLTNDGNR